MTNNTEMEKYFFRASSEEFKKIPGSPVAYWLSSNFIDVFDNSLLESITISDGQNKTGNNDRFVRFFWELSSKKIGPEIRWFFYAKGGGFRKWYGNIIDVVDWSDEAREHYKKDRICRIIPEYLWHKKGITWGLITSSKPSFRVLPEMATFDVGGSSVFFKEEQEIDFSLALLNTKIALKILNVVNPTLNYQVRNIREVPYLSLKQEHRRFIDQNAKAAVEISKQDWDSYEISWDFTSLPLLSSEDRQATLADTYAIIRQQWLDTTLEMQRLEEENNRIFIDAYGLQDELTPDVPLEEITLTCNPHYRYRLGKAWDDKTEEERSFELETRLQQDTMAEFISYAVGCMFGRYSLDKEGLVLANQGESLADYLAQVPNPSFEVDDDNVIPILEADWFADDIVERFRKFLRVTFGEEHFSANLEFIEKALGKDVRSYFLRDFYNDHVQRYKKRPIYWMFSSPKGSFNALIYMHRYRSDTVSIVLNEYLREFRTKLEAQIEHQETIEASASASSSKKTRALKEIDRLKKVLVELNDYERDTLYPLATEQVSIDLDDGVKVNYPKFGNALKKITGLS